MKKAVVVIIETLCVLFMLWFVVSWADIVADNSQPNPHHSPYNLFVIMTKDKQEEEETAAAQVYDTSMLESWCGEPNGRIRMIGGWITDAGLIEDETGNLWVYEFESDVDYNSFLLLWFDDMGTDDITDDEIVKVWQEVW